MKTKQNNNNKKKHRCKKLKTQLSSFGLEITGLTKNQLNLVSRFVARKGNIFESADCQKKKKKKKKKYFTSNKNKGLKTKTKKIEFE